VAKTMKMFLLMMSLIGMLIVVFSIFRFMSDVETGVALLALGFFLFGGAEILRRIVRK
jgi:hypothetical protein